MFADVSRDCDACGLEHGSDHSCSWCADGDGFAIFFDDGLLEAIKVVEQRLPFGLEPLGFAQPGQFLGQYEGEERAEQMPADRSVGLVEDRPCVEASLGSAEQGSTWSRSR